MNLFVQDVFFPLEIAMIIHVLVQEVIIITTTTTTIIITIIKIIYIYLFIFSILILLLLILSFILQKNSFSSF